MNSLLEYKRIKNAINKKNNNLKNDDPLKIKLNEYKEVKKKTEIIQPKKNKINEYLDNKNEIKVNKIIEILNNEKCKKQYTLENNINDICEEDKKKAIELKIYDYCYICEKSKPCFCNENDIYEENIIKWNKMKSNKSNIFSNFKDITNLMKIVQENKKKQDITNKEKPKDIIKKEYNTKHINKKNIKNLTNYEKFCLENVKRIKEKIENIKNGIQEDNQIDERNLEKEPIINIDTYIKERLYKLKEIEKNHLKILYELFEENISIKKKFLP